jgi:multidrug efflux pump subunit AcrB
MAFRKRKTTAVQPQDRLLPKLTMFFFKRSRTAALIWLIIAVFGVVSYTTLLKREGFPSINVPFVIVNGTYAVNDASQVDKTLAKPVSEIALQQKDVDTVMSQSESNFFTAFVQYSEKTDGNVAKNALEKAVRANANIPSNAKLEFNAPYFGVTGAPTTEKIDATISVYDTTGKLSLNELKDRAQTVKEYLDTQNISEAQSFKVSDPFENVTNPLTGEQTTVQRTFDQFGTRQAGQNKFYKSVVVNVAAIKNVDVIQLDSQIQAALDKLNAKPEFSDVHTAISASSGPQIKESISELQRVLLEGLLAVLIIGSIVIAVRASLITVLAMITVLLAAIGLLYLLGYTLNVITLFGLILSLSLIVDDTIIMTEAIDAARKRNQKASAAVEEATRKISRAMVAATLTAALSFTPLLFVGGVLGSFIRAIPVTIISALLISLFTALILIPLFAKYLLLGKKQMGENNVRELAAGIEEKIAHTLAKPMLWARHSRLKEFGVGLAAILFSVIFIGAGVAIFRNVEFNIFPATKDTNLIGVQLVYPPNTTTEQAQVTATRADKITANVVGENFIEGSYYGVANNQTANLFVELVPYADRDITGPQIVKNLDKAFKNFEGAKADAITVDVGPPTSGFIVNITAENRGEATRLAHDMAAYLKGQELKRLSGKVAHITETSVSNTSTFERTDAKPIIKVTSTFDGTDTSTLTTLAEKKVHEKFTNKELAKYGLTTKDVNIDLGQESENQDSFKTLALAFPIVLAVIFVLLAVQFRSLLQPLLIFMAIPFSFFGIALGLYLTHNAFSFFTMLGFFALIGLSLKNTILLTDYANQAKRAGMGPVDAANAALSERFRPLFATSLTAVVSLIPLAVTSPFWEGLAITLIGGLLSSTFLVVTVFPYYYLGGEYARWKTGNGVRRITRFLKVVIGYTWLKLNQAYKHMTKTIDKR